MSLDAGDRRAIADCARAHRADVIVNACDPRFVMPLFDGAHEAGCTYLDMAMSLSRPHPERPHEQCGIKLGGEQFAAAHAWEQAGQLALVGMGVEPGLSDVLARHAADELFSEVTRSACATARTLWLRLRLRPNLLHLDHDRGVPQPACGLGTRARLVHHRPAQQA